YVDTRLTIGENRDILICPAELNHNHTFVKLNRHVYPGPTDDTDGSIEIERIHSDPHPSRLVEGPS
ncbi:MAG TPA: hypothetical protein P5172_11015, partial [Syntrophales bacterium]|nr:hypothetical protein [Syntrophales bacterium]